MEYKGKNDNQGPMKKSQASEADATREHTSGIGSGSVIKRAVHGTRPFGGDVKRGKD